MSKRAIASVALAAAFAGWAAPASAQAPVRPGGLIAEPKKIVDVRPVYPEIAQQARIQGIVILELIVGVDGSVTDARVLRPAPMLDQAALEAVRQWKYTPTLLNGAPVPVIMTVTVTFTLDGGSPHQSTFQTQAPAATDVPSLIDHAKAVHGRGLLAETEQTLLKALQAVQQERIRLSAERVGGAVAPLRVGAGSPAGIPAPAVLSSVSPGNVVGITIVEVAIDVTGRVTDVNILRPSGASDAAVAEAVRQWRFAPTMVNGVAVPVITTITVR